MAETQPWVQLRAAAERPGAVAFRNSGTGAIRVLQDGEKPPAAYVRATPEEVERWTQEGRWN